MTQRLLVIAFALALIGWSCNNSTDQQQADDMADFASDEEFKDKHEEPEAVEFAPQGKNMTFDTPDGQTGSAYALMAAEESNKYLFVIHEWWGLNDNIRQEADRLFGELENVNIMALDLYEGQVADNADDAGKYMQAASQKQDRLEAIINGALAYAGDDAKVATIGWCFGGGWSLRSSILAADKGAGCVIYYGMPVQDKDALAPLQGDILGIFATQDAWITPEVATNFETLAKDAGKNIAIHQFEADHAFANPSSPRYVEEAAQEANALALAFLKERL
ncbi:MAG: dienelactone hydrolase family protein [Bacteroidota bacterium]